MKQIIERYMYALQITKESIPKKKKRGREIQDPRQRSHSSRLKQMTRHQLVYLKSNREDQGRNGKRKAQSEAETNKPDGKNSSGAQAVQESAGGGREC